MNSSKKVLLVINVDNVVDIITNSSSELFVLNADTKDIVKEMIENVYPDYMDEYDEVVSLKEASDSKVETYYSWVIDAWYDRNTDYYKMSREEIRNKEVAHYKKQAEIYGLTPSKFYSNWDLHETDEYFHANISSKGYDAIRKYHDPNGTLFLLFSIDENPNYDMQQNLETIATRYHLG